MKHHTILFIPLALAGLLLGGCGGGSDTESSAEIQDVTAEVQEYYSTFKRVPPELQAQLATGSITQEDFNRQMEDIPLFFQFKTIADLPTGLNWETGMELPEIGDEDAIKGGTLYAALSDPIQTVPSGLSFSMTSP